MTDRPTELPEAEVRLVPLSLDQIAHLHSVGEAAQARAEKAARDRRHSRRFPPEFIVKALEDDAALLYAICEAWEAARPTEGETR